MNISPEAKDAARSAFNNDTDWVGRTSPSVVITLANLELVIQSAINAATAGLREENERLQKELSAVRSCFAEASHAAGPTAAYADALKAELERAQKYIEKGVLALFEERDALKTELERVHDLLAIRTDALNEANEFRERAISENERLALVTQAWQASFEKKDADFQAARKTCDSLRARCETLEAQVSGKSALLTLALELEQKKDAFILENFSYDPTTGVWEGGKADEWVQECEELIEEIRIKAESLTPPTKDIPTKPQS